MSEGRCYSHPSCAHIDENTAPSVNPVGPAAPNSENTMFLFMPIGKVLPTKAMAFGTKRAGPIPCNARHALSTKEL